MDLSSLRHVLPMSSYQTLQEFTGYMGAPLVHPKAFPNSSKFWMAPLTRPRPGDCGSAAADCRAARAPWFSHQTWANDRKNRYFTL
jgi:hypothetical protein